MQPRKLSWLQTGAFIPHDYLKFYFLERQLIMDVAEQFERAHIRHVLATQFDSRWFTGQFRMRFRHFPVEQK
jgi:hypothetical protein